MLGTGVDVCYPKENRKLYEKVLERDHIRAIGNQLRTLLDQLVRRKAHRLRHESITGGS